MGNHVNEQAAARDFFLHAPAPVVVGHVGDGEIDLPVDRRADAAIGDELLHLQNVRMVAAIVGDEQLDPGLVASGDHLGVFVGIHAHGLFHEDVLAGPGGGQNILLVRHRRRGHIDDVDVRVVDDLASVIGAETDVVGLSKGPDLGGLATHHADDAAAAGLQNRRAALLLDHVAATDDTPAKWCSHYSPPCSAPSLAACSIS